MHEGFAAPDDHFTATPNCCVRRSTLRRVSRASSYPTIAGWIVSAASVQRKPRAEGITSPDNHFGTSPHCRVIVSSGGRVDDASARPAIRGGIVSPAGAVISTAPDDHFAASPDRLVICPASTAGSYPVVGFRIVSSAVIEVGIGPRRNIEKESAPDDHFLPGPHCGVCSSRARPVAGAGGHPSVGLGIVSPTGIRVIRIRKDASAPDDHLATSPDCRVV
jgi:hypothetical protein